MAYQNNQRGNQQHSLPRLRLGFTQVEKSGKQIMHLEDTDLFDQTAKKWADAVKNAHKTTKATQARNFYDKVLELQKDIKSNDFASVYPFVKMLNSKVAYAENRGVVSTEFKEMMEQCLNQIENNDKGKQIFENFKLFFEAFLGFYKEKKS